MDRIVRSGSFVGSPRRQRFLEYIVHETLAGRGGRLKGYTVALEVFGRPDTFNPNPNPLVRIEAGRLREKLHFYYETDGLADPVHIKLPRGGYKPHFALRNSTNGSVRSALNAQPGTAGLGKAKMSRRTTHCLRG